jgi:N-acetylmuramic acid 6-phosphate etherase
MSENESHRLAQLGTERRNERTAEMDTLSTSNLVSVLHEENHLVAGTIDPLLPTLSKLVDEITERLHKGGRILYVGAGTSGRLGVLDASECPPTFGVSPEMVQGIIAGGNEALVSSIEGAEDSSEQGKLDVAQRNPSDVDVVIGIAASGRTPYVIGALEYARSIGCLTAGVTNVANSQLAAHADYALEAVTGAEPLTGSTRLKAGTAQKMILNLITTAVMVRFGKVYQNLMVDVKATNEKLKHRAIRIVEEASGAPKDVCREALEKCDWNAKTAIFSIQLQISAAEASKLLTGTKGHLRKALDGKRS